MKENIKIKSESYAKRCEICHKEEYFDPIKNYCSLCENSVKHSLNLNKRTSYSILEKQKISIFSNIFQRFLSFIIAVPLTVVATYLSINLLDTNFRGYEISFVNQFSKLSWPTLTVFYVAIRLLLFGVISDKHKLRKTTKWISRFFLLPMLFITGNVIYHLLGFIFMAPGSIILLWGILILPLLLISIDAFYTFKIKTSI